MMANNSNCHVDHYSHACGKPIGELELAVMTRPTQNLTQLVQASGICLIE